MGWLSNLSTRSKLMLGFSTLLVLLVLVSVLAATTALGMESTERTIVDQRLAPSTAVLQARAQLNHARGDVLQLALTTNKADWPAIEADLTATAAQAAERIGAAQAILQAAGDTMNAAALARVSETFIVYKQGLAQEVALIHDGSVAEAVALANGVQVNRVDAMRADLDAVVTGLQAEAAAAVDAARVQVNNALALFVVVTILAVFAVLALLWVLDRLLTVPLRRASDMADAMSRGDLSGRLDLHRRDEIGRLAASMDDLANTVVAMSSEASTLLAAASGGRLSVRGDESRFQGVYEDIVRGVNQALDAVTGPLTVVARHLERIAGGEIPAALSGELSGDFEVLQANVNTMTAVLRDLNRDTTEGVSVLAAASSEILATVSQLAGVTAETAASVTETSTTVEEVKQTAHLTAQRARDVQESALQTAAIGESGRAAAIETVAGMDRIRGQMGAIADAIVRLSELGQSIGEIITTVNDLAEQSNMLAVNAAIEATRAGEYGKGFAVVAQEVKSLADQSRQATTQVRSILSDVQKATSSAVMATEQGNKTVADGVRQAGEAGESIRRLADAIGEAADAATQIVASADQQLVGMEQIAMAMTSIRQATSQNVAGTRQLEVSAQSLTSTGDRLRHVVERQRVEA
ncbi:MAG: methyl-accepting chemotaxis protein [Chloroflexota bacterium]